MHHAIPANGSSLTYDEMRQVRVDFRKMWDEMDNHDSFVESYEDWRKEAPEKPLSKIVAYDTVWGEGCATAPLAPSELQAYVAENGWPSNRTVRSSRLSIICFG